MCLVPLDIRQVDDHYILIGDTYVHSVMDGEVSRHLNDGSFQPESFALR